MQQSLLFTIAQLYRSSWYPSRPKWRYKQKPRYIILTCKCKKSELHLNAVNNVHLSMHASCVILLSIYHTQMNTYWIILLSVSVLVYLKNNVIVIYYFHIYIYIYIYIYIMCKYWIYNCYCYMRITHHYYEFKGFLRCIIFTFYLSVWFLIILRFSNWKIQLFYGEIR